MGLFTYDVDEAYNHREIDIEFSKWGESKMGNSQFVVQPEYDPQNICHFDSNLADNYTTQSFYWNATSITFESLYGHYTSDPGSSSILNSWNYSGKNIPPKGKEVVGINLWNFDEIAPSTEIEVIIKKFEFIPLKDNNPSN